MPTSVNGAINPIIDRIMEWKPRKILDVGIGWGKYGLLCREYLQPYGCLERIDGVEIWEPYIGPIQKAIYDNIYNEDIVTHEFKTDYDLVLLIDVIEHITKKQGIELLDRINAKVIVSTPVGFMESGEHYGNKYEAHKSGWNMTDFYKYGIKSEQTLSNPWQCIYFLDLKK